MIRNSLFSFFSISSPSSLNTYGGGQYKDISWLKLKKLPWAKNSRFASCPPRLYLCSAYLRPDTSPTLSSFSSGLSALKKSFEYLTPRGHPFFVLGDLNCCSTLLCGKAVGTPWCAREVALYHLLSQAAVALCDFSLCDDTADHCRLLGSFIPNGGSQRRVRSLRTIDCVLVGNVAMDSAGCPDIRPVLAPAERACTMRRLHHPTLRPFVADHYPVLVEVFPHEGGGGASASSGQRRTRTRRLRPLEHPPLRLSPAVRGADRFAAPCHPAPLRPVIAPHWDFASLSTDQDKASAFLSKLSAVSDTFVARVTAARQELENLPPDRRPAAAVESVDSLWSTFLQLWRSAWRTGVGFAPPRPRAEARADPDEAQAPSPEDGGPVAAQAAPPRGSRPPTVDAAAHLPPVHEPSATIRGSLRRMERLLRAACKKCGLLARLLFWAKSGVVHVPQSFKDLSKRLRGARAHTRALRSEAQSLRAFLARRDAEEKLSNPATSAEAWCAFKALACGSDSSPRPSAPQYPSRMCHEGAWLDPAESFSRFWESLEALAGATAATAAASRARPESQYPLLTPAADRCSGVSLPLAEAPGVSPDTLCALIKSKVREGKSCGLDGVTAEELRWAPLQAATMLSTLFQLCFDFATTPTDWGCSFVTHIPKKPHMKKSEREDPAFYRPISVASFVSRLFEHCILHALSSSPFADRVHPLQYGFRDGFGCQEALLTLSSWIYVGRNHLSANPADCLPSYVAALDFTRAFDLVSRDVLFEKLSDFLDAERDSVGAGIFLSIKSLYRSTTARVRSGPNLYGRLLSQSVGIRQGAVLSPFLFSVIMNALLLHLEKAGIPLPSTPSGLPYNTNDNCSDPSTVLPLVYADDVAVVCRSLEDFSAAHCLRFNPAKCKILPCLPGVPAVVRRQQEQQPISLLGSELEEVATLRYLGAQLNQWGSLDPKSLAGPRLRDFKSRVKFVVRNLTFGSPSAPTTLTTRCGLALVDGGILYALSASVCHPSWLRAVDNIRVKLLSAALGARWTPLALHLTAQAMTGVPLLAVTVPRLRLSQLAKCLAWEGDPRAPSVLVYLVKRHVLPSCLTLFWQLLQQQSGSPALAALCSGEENFRAAKHRHWGMEVVRDLHRLLPGDLISRWMRLPAASAGLVGRLCHVFSDPSLAPAPKEVATRILNDSFALYGAPLGPPALSRCCPLDLPLLLAPVNVLLPEHAHLLQPPPALPRKDRLALLRLWKTLLKSVGTVSTSWAVSSMISHHSLLSLRGGVLRSSPDAPFALNWFAVLWSGLRYQSPGAPLGPGLVPALPAVPPFVVSDLLRLVSGSPSGRVWAHAFARLATGANELTNHLSRICDTLGKPSASPAQGLWRRWLVPSAVLRHADHLLDPQLDPWGICPFCALRDPEDSVHHVLLCPAFDDLRRAMLAAVSGWWRAALAGSPLLEVFEAALLDYSRAIAPGGACSTPAPLLDLRSEGFRAWVMTRRTAFLPLFQLLLCGPSCLLLFHSATPGTPPVPRPENWVERWECLGKPPSVRASSLGSMVGAPCWTVLGGRIQLAFTQLFAVPAVLKRVTLLEEALPEADSVPPPITPPPSPP